MARETAVGNDAESGVKEHSVPHLIKCVIATATNLI